MVKGSPPPIMTPPEIVVINIVRQRPHIRRSCAYTPEGTSALCTCQCIPFKSLTLKLKVNDVDDLEENWQANVPCQQS